MAIVKEFNDASDMTLAEFVDIAKGINPDDELEILALAPHLHRLANNKTLLQTFIADGLKNVTQFQAGNPYSAQTYVLTDVTPRSFMRLAIWSPPGHFTELDESRFFAYDIAHDHNFSLLTAGLLGSGYTTSVYQLKEGTTVHGVVGESVQLTDAQHLQLSPGKVILYEAQKDIHIQHPPADLSVSLNFMVDQRERCTRQLYYDVVRNKVSAHAGSERMKRADFFKFAALLNDAECNALLGEISAAHACELTRIYAHLAVAKNTDPAAAAERMLRDPSPLVRASAAIAQ